MSTLTSQKIILINDYIQEIENIKQTFKNKFNIDDNVPFSEYANLIQPEAQEGLTLYKAESHQFKAGNPEYDNFSCNLIKSDESSSESTVVNLQFKNALVYNTNFDRKWIDESNTYKIQVGTAYDSYSYRFWGLFKTDRESTDKYYALAYSKIYSTDGDGSSSNPYIWDKILDNSDLTGCTAKITNLSSGSNISLCIKVLANKQYTLTFTNNMTNGYCYFSMYNTDDSYIEVNNNVATFTPPKDGVCYISIYCDGTVDESSYITISSSTKPEEFGEFSSNPWENDWTVNNSYSEGNVNFTEISFLNHQVVEAKDDTKTWCGYEAFKHTNEKGQEYFTYAETLTSGLTWNYYCPQKGDIMDRNGGVRITNINENESNQYNEYATVWQVDIPSANYTYRSVVFTTGNDNVIDWGDGNQTALQNSSTGIVYTHIYENAGQYIIQVIGTTITRLFPYSSTSSAVSTGSSYKDNTLVKNVFHLGKSISTCEYMFYDCRRIGKYI